MISSRARLGTSSRLFLALAAAASSACVLPGADLVEGEGGASPTSNSSTTGTSSTSSVSGSGGDGQGGSTSTSTASAGGGGSGGDTSTSTGNGGDGGGAGGTGGTGDGGTGGSGTASTGTGSGGDGGGGGGPLPLAIQLEAGNGHACVVHDDETAHCWGRNDRAQLGFDTAPRGESWVAGRAEELPTGVLAIALGDRFTCAVVRGPLDETRVRCWGEDTDGQTGGVGVSQPTKVEYPSGGADVEDIVELGAGYRFACARIQGGDVACWGDGSQRSLGSARPDSPDAIDIDLDDDAIDIGLNATASMACAVLAGGVVQCWGDGFDVETVPGTDDATSVSVGAIGAPAPSGSEVVFAIDDGRVAWNRREGGAWLGYVGFGEFGEEIGVGEARDVEVGLHEVCVVTVDDALYCAPYDLGGLPDEDLLVEVFASGVEQVALGAAGASYVGPSFGTRCVRFTDGATRCQGSNVEGGVGNGRELYEATPVPIVGPTDVRGVALGGKATISFEGDTPTSRAWGESTVLGVVDAISPTSPTPLIPAGTSRLDFGRFASDEAYVWGAATMFHLRVNGAMDDTVRLPALLLPFVEGKAATIRDIGRTDAGAVVTLCRVGVCNNHGAMGNGMNTVPNPLSHTLALGTFVASEVFGTSTASHHCALGVDDGAEQLICWGRSNYGQVGDGTTGSTGEVHTPTIVIDDGAIDACIGTNRTCAVVDEGGTTEVRCWGRGGAGGPAGDEPEPVTMPGTSGALGVACGLEFTCTWRVDGSVLCWGENEDGQLGDGTLTAHTGPEVVDGLSNVTEVVAGSSHACAIHESGTLSCWGRNDDGQVGAGVPIFYETLVDVAFGDGT